MANFAVPFYAKAARFFASIDQVSGFCARTDRYKQTQEVGRAGEINLYAISRFMADTSLKAEEVTQAFLTTRYNKKVAKALSEVFLSSYPMLLQTLYTMGTHSANHSTLSWTSPCMYTYCMSLIWKDLEDDTLQRSGKTLHFWKDVALKMIPPEYKKPGGRLQRAKPELFEQDWWHAQEAMDEALLDLIVQEKASAVDLAKINLEKVKKAEKLFTDKADYYDLRHLFERTVLVTELRKSSAEMYFSKRIYEQQPSPAIKKRLLKSTRETKVNLRKMWDYYAWPRSGQWKWTSDIDYSLGWPMRCWRN